LELPVNSIRRLTVSVLHAGAKPIDGLVALWSAEGNADDSVGNRHGQLQNQTGYAPGKIGQAFAFHGIGDGITAPTTDLPIGTSDRTIDCWVYIESFNPGQQGQILGYGFFGAAGKSYALCYKPDHRLFFSQWGDALFGSTLDPGQWYNIAVTSVGTSSIKLYVDGVNVATGALDFNTPAGGQFFMGKATLPQTEFYGLIDEVAVYNRALSDDEIKAISEEAAPAKPAPAH